jgi:hypothetical protein
VKTSKSSKTREYMVSSVAYLFVFSDALFCFETILFNSAACQSKHYPEIVSSCAWWSILLGIILKDIKYSAYVHSLPGGIDL